MNNNTNNNRIAPVALENVKIGFRNFAGRADQYNKQGVRGFAVFLSYEKADELAAIGWNVKYPKPNPNIPADEDVRLPYIQLTFSLENIPPKMVMFHNGVPTPVDASNVDCLDWIQFESCDVVIRPYVWSVNGNTGVKAYVKALYVNVAVDEFYEKYGV